MSNPKDHMESLTLIEPQPVHFVVEVKEGRLLTIKPDGTIERGPAFTTEDQASLQFWEALERTGLRLVRGERT